MAKDDDAREALKRRLANSQGAAALGGGVGVDHKRLGAGGRAAGEDFTQRLQDQARAAANAPIRLYVVMDTTYSMTNVINAVKATAGNIGKEILEADKGIEACVLGFGEHQSNFPTHLLPQGSQQWGDYGQFNPFTSNSGLFVTQAQGILAYSESGRAFHNPSDLEAYECAAHDLTAMIQKAQRANPQQKHVVVLMGDSGPHDASAREYDSEPCPMQRGPGEIRLLVEHANHTYFVDCAATASATASYFKHHTFEQAVGQKHPKATYVEFARAEEVLPEFIIGMVKQERGQLVNYLRQLTAGGEGDKATKVAGLLGTGKK